MFFISNLVPLSSLTCLLCATADTGARKEFLWLSIETHLNSGRASVAGEKVGLGANVLLQAWQIM